MIDSLQGQYRAGRIEATAQSKESGCSHGGTSTSYVTAASAGASQSLQQKEIVMWRSMLLLVLSCLFSLTSLAQKVEVFGGYQFTHLEPAFNANGWNVAVTGNFKHILGITGDFSGAYKDRVNAYTYTVGPVLTARLPVVQPFVHALFGGITLSGNGSNVGSDTGFAMLLGGGLDVGLRKGIGIRILQADWMSTRFSGNTLNKNVRVSAGIVVKF